MILVNDISVLALGLLEAVTCDRDEVDSKRLWLDNPSRQTTVLEAGKHVSAHRKVYVLGLEVAKTIKFCFDSLLDLVIEVLARTDFDTVVIVLLHVLTEDRGIDRAVGIVLDDVKSADMGQIFGVHSGCH